MGVLSDGSNYGIPEGIVYSYPMTIGSDGQWKIINCLAIDDFSREKMDKTAKELQEEKEACDVFLQDWLMMSHLWDAAIVPLLLSGVENKTELCVLGDEHWIIQ